jgi:hypothetical protein
MHLKKRREELSAPRSDGCPAGRIMRRPQFPGDIKTDPLWQPVSVGNCVIGDGRSRFEGEWQIRVTPCEASMTDAENVTDATCPDQHEATGAPTRMPSVTCLIVRSRPGAQAIPTPTPACTPPKGTASASSAVTTRAARRSRRLMRFLRPSPVSRRCCRAANAAIARSLCGVLGHDPIPCPTMSSVCRSSTPSLRRLSSSVQSRGFRNGRRTNFVTPFSTYASMQRRNSAVPTGMTSRIATRCWLTRRLARNVTSRDVGGPWA